MDRSEWYAKLKELHLCHDCKKKDAYTMAGRYYCADCSEKRRMYIKARRADTVKRQSELQKQHERIEKLKQDHKCIWCGKAVYNGKRLCPTCGEKSRRWWKQYRGLNPRELGVICWQCNKNPCADGHKLCAECYEKQSKIARENLKNVDMENHQWREENRKLYLKSE